MNRRGPDHGATGSYLSHLWEKIRYKHPVAVALDGLARLGLHIVPFLLTVRILDPDPVDDAAISDLEIGFLSEADMSKIAALPYRDVGLDELIARLEADNLCLGARSREKLVAFIWADLDRVNFPGCYFDLAPNESYQYDGYVAPKLRGRRILPELTRRLGAELVRRGRPVSYQVVNRFNTPSRRYLAKLGDTVVTSGIWAQAWGMSSPPVSVSRELLSAGLRRAREALAPATAPDHRR